MNLLHKSKRLAYLLRHDKSYAFDGHGWREVEDLIRNHGFSMPMLESIVATNNKQRFEFNEDKTKIRARQGHSVNVDVELKVATPPDILYHGTSEDVVSSILNDGIKPGARLHVHLSSDAETAIKVGRRHGSPVVLKIDVAAMNADGVRFYLSNNDVWLTDFIAPKYISLIDL
ncbi:MAG: RNA 2'-phosphotransferase [Muribaculaceae bacterium]|jgi:probable RNA 2'-phosphotransferase